MINYGDAILWCVQKGAVMRFVTRDTRREFLGQGMAPDAIALELAITDAGQTYVAHAPLDTGREPSKAVALALISCVEFFEQKKARPIDREAVALV